MRCSRTQLDFMGHDSKPASALTWHAPGLRTPYGQNAVFTRRGMEYPQFSGSWRTGAQDRPCGATIHGTDLLGRYFRSSQTCNRIGAEVSIQLCPVESSCCGAGLVQDPGRSGFRCAGRRGHPEQPPIFGASEGLQVPAEEAGKLRGERDRPDGAFRAVFEAARFAWGRRCQSRHAPTGQGRGECQLSPAACGEDAGVRAQCDGFGGSQCRVVQAAEERGQGGGLWATFGQDRPHLGRCGRRPGPVQAQGQRVQRAPGHLQVGHGGQRQTVMFTHYCDGLVVNLVP